MLSYQARRNRGTASSEINTSRSTASQSSQNRVVYRGPSNGLPGPVDMNIQGRSAVGPRGMLLNGSRPDIYGMGFRFLDHDSREQLTATSLLPRHDLLPVSEEIPQDGVIFARVKNHPEMLVVFRTPEERSRNPERLNLDRRQLDVCPLLEQEQRLRLLNFQNNNIRNIQNLENLPNLIFLDLYNNKLTSLDGPLSSVSGLRVLMAGKNRITMISNLTNLRKLDVLDLHSNEIREIDGMAGLADLRVLNLAGNRLSVVRNLSSLQALTELNLRRNCIQKLCELDKIPALQRVFLSHNLIVSLEDMQCIFHIRFLIELSLDGNPLSQADPNGYRRVIIASIPGLRHLDLKRITDEERSAAVRSTAQDSSSRSGAAAGGDSHSHSGPSPNTNIFTSVSSSVNLDDQQEASSVLSGAGSKRLAVSRSSAGSLNAQEHANEAAANATSHSADDQNSGGGGAPQTSLSAAPSQQSLTGGGGGTGSSGSPDKQSQALYSAARSSKSSGQGLPVRSMFELEVSVDVGT